MVRQNPLNIPKYRLRQLKRQRLGITRNIVRCDRSKPFLPDSDYPQPQGLQSLRLVPILCFTFSMKPHSVIFNHRLDRRQVDIDIEPWTKGMMQFSVGKD
jgi:hypothetical protein